MAAVGAVAAAVSDTTGNVPAAAALQAQLQRLQQQLSDCVNCADAKSPQNKATADALRSKISQLESRIQQSDQVSERRERLLNSGKVEPATSLAAQSGTVSPTAKGAGVGQIIDVFA
jgi:cob(I)alamin adenosyltransferase